MSVLSDIQKRHKAYLEGDDEDIRRVSKNLIGWMHGFVQESLADGLSEDAIIETLEEHEAEAGDMLKALAGAGEDADARERVGKSCGKPHGKKKAKARLFAEVHKGAATGSDGFEIAVPITKTNDELQVVYGWASVTKVNGAAVVDLQDDVIETTELVKAVQDFMLDSRKGGIMHMRGDDGPVVIGAVVESIVLTEDVQKTLGIDLGREGWFIGIKVMHESVWKMVKDGKLKAFSIGGSGARVPIEG